MTWALCILVAYLLGSVPFGLLIGLSRGIDIRKAGSGNVGATNVSRLLGRRVGVTCFVLDAAKGAVPVVVAGLLNDVWGRPAAGSGAAEPRQTWLWLAVGAAALLGHITSPWLSFRGGKGVATGFGAMLAMWPHLTWPALAALIIWLIVVRASRYVSLASMTAAASLPLLSTLLALRPGPDLGERLRGNLPIILSTAMLALLVIYRHRGNIGRLRAGTESRISSAQRQR